MVVLEAEAAMAIAQALANDVASSVFTPPLRVSTRYCFGVSPAYLFGIVIEESRSPLPTAGATAIPRPVRRRAHIFLGWERERAFDGPMPIGDDVGIG